MYFLSLKQVSDNWDECESKIEQQLYLIKNMEKLDKESKPYKSGEYEDLFKASEIASMAKEDIVEYRNSILMEMDRQSAIDFAKEEGREEGKMEVARQMKIRGMSLGDIMLFTGLSEQQIQELWCLLFLKKKMTDVYFIKK